MRGYESHGAGRGGLMFLGRGSCDGEGGGEGKQCGEHGGGMHFAKLSADCCLRSGCDVALNFNMDGSE